MHEGHRKRIIERLSGDDDNLQDHELLEILLFNAIPRKNTNPIAHALIDAFGSLENVFTADIENLKEVEGVGQSVAEYLRCVGLIYSRVESKKNIPISAANLHEFSTVLKNRYQNLPHEVIEFFFLDSKYWVKMTKRYSSHDGGKVKVPTEEITKVLAAHRSESLVVAHNHPGSSSKPSAQDDRFTGQLHMYCCMNGVNLRDHVIVGQDDSFSYFYSGRIENIRHEFDVEKMLAGKRIE